MSIPETTIDIRSDLALEMQDKYLSFVEDLDTDTIAHLKTIEKLVNAALYKEQYSTISLNVTISMIGDEALDRLVMIDNANKRYLEGLFVSETLREAVFEYPADELMFTVNLVKDINRLFIKTISFRKRYYA